MCQQNEEKNKKQKRTIISNPQRITNSQRITNGFYCREMVVWRENVFAVFTKKHSEQNDSSTISQSIA